MAKDDTWPSIVQSSGCHHVCACCVCTQVGADLGRHGGYMPAIIKATADIDVQIVFCNAGYILPGFFYTK